MAEGEDVFFLLIQRWRIETIGLASGIEPLETGRSNKAIIHAEMPRQVLRDI